MVRYGGVPLYCKVERPGIQFLQDHNVGAAPEDGLVLPEVT